MADDELRKSFQFEDEEGNPIEDDEFAEEFFGGEESFDDESDLY